MSITLWHMVASPPSWSVRMLANILGLEVELKDIDFLKMEHKSPEYTKMNPMGTVPTIKDGDFIISESHTIMKYLLEKYGKEDQKTLYPKGLKESALVDQAMYFDTGVAFIRIKNIALPALFGDATEISPAVIKEVEDVYSIVEAYLKDKSFVASSEFTIADIALGSTITCLNEFCSVGTERYPKTLSWLKKLHDKQFFKKIALPGAKTTAAVVNSCWENNKLK